MRQIAGKAALITGAGSGIGRATAIALAREGANLIVCDIDEGRLRAIEEEVNSITHCLMAEVVDVSNREWMRSFADKVHGKVPALDILINNAGIGMSGTVLDMRLEDWDRILGINLWGVIYGVHFFAPKMAERGEGGHIVNVSSMLGYWGGPKIVGYGTTKFGVFGFSQSCRQDLAAYNVGVTCICPGMIRTSIIQQTDMVGEHDAEALRTKVDQAYIKRNYPPEKVAVAIVEAIKRNRAIVPVSPEAWLIYYVNRFSPGLAQWMAARLGKEMLE